MSANSLGHLGNTRPPTRRPAQQVINISATEQAHAESSLVSTQHMAVASFRSVFAILSALSFGSFLSLMSLFSAGSVLSIGSAGSLLSLFSVGSVLSVGCVGEFLSVCY